MNQMEQPQLYGIFPEWHIPFWQTKAFFWTILSVFALAILVLFYFIYRWYVAKKQPEIPYWQQTLSLITSLQQENYISPEQSKQCYFTLTAAIKSYLSKRFSYPIAQATDEQAAQYLETTDLSPQLKKQLQEILRGCMLIKFANQNALDEHVQHHLQLAHTVVTKTIPQPESKKS